MNIPPLKEGYYAVFIETLRLDMRLGVYPEEVTPQPVQIDIAAIVRRLGPGDGIEDVVDYNHLRDDALALAEERHFGLQETYCEALIGRLRDRETIYGVTIETRKLSAFADSAAIGCRMTDIDPGVLSR
ncbi:MAG: dihydroneopterin aldolase [Pseudomonadota bacterium]